MPEEKDSLSSTGIRLYSINESVNREQKNSVNSPELKVYTPKILNPEVRKGTIEALKKIRGMLAQKRETSMFVPRLEFNSWIIGVKQEAKDLEVARKIDEIFDEFMLSMPSKKVEIFAPSIENTINDAIANENVGLESPEQSGYDDGESMGSAKVKRDGHYKSQVPPIEVA